MNSLMQGNNARIARNSFIAKPAKCYPRGMQSLLDLLTQWFKNHSQVEFAKAAGVRESTVSRWKNAGIPPTFENCLRIALAMNEHPRRIFAAIEKPEFDNLFDKFFADYEPKPAPLQTPAYLPEHIEWHSKLEYILRSGNDYAAGIMLNLAAIHSYVTNNPAPKRKKFSAWDERKPTDRVVRKEPVKKVRGV